MPNLLENTMNAIQSFWKDNPQGDKVIKDLTGDDFIDISEELNKKYKNDLDNARKWHKKRYYKTAKKYYNYMRGIIGEGETTEFNREGPNSLEAVFCNEFWVNVKTIIPNVYFQNPKAIIQAESNYYEVMVEGNPEPVKMPIDPKATEILENTVMDYYRKLDLKNEAKRALSDGLVAGFGVLTANWRTELKGSENADLGLISDDLTGGWFPSVNFMNDPEGTDPKLKDSKYIVLRYFKPTSYIKHSPLYKGVSELKGKRVLKFSGDDKDADDSLYSNNTGENTPDVERNELSWIYSMETKKIVVYVDGIDKPIRYIDWDSDRYPVSILMFNPDPEYFYPIPDFRAYEQQVLIKTKLRRKMVKLFNTLNKVYLIDEDVLGKNPKDKVQRILDADDGGVETFKNTQNKTRDQILINLNDYVFNDSHIALQSIIDTDITALSGVSDFVKGQVTKTKRTAQEIMNLSQAMNLRIEEKKDCIADWLEDYTMLIIKNLQENVQDQRVTKILRDTGVDFLSWTNDKIQGNFSAKIDVGSMIKQNPEMQAKLATDQYAQFVDNPLMNQVWVIKNLLKKTGNSEISEALNQMEVKKYENPQLSQILNAISANPMLMQAIMKIISTMPPPVQGTQGQGNKPPVGGSQIGVQEARTGQVNPVAELAPKV